MIQPTFVNGLIIAAYMFIIRLIANTLAAVWSQNPIGQALSIIAA